MSYSQPTQFPLIVTPPSNRSTAYSDTTCLLNTPRSVPAYFSYTTSAQPPQSSSLVEHHDTTTTLTHAQCSSTFQTTPSRKRTSSAVSDSARTVCVVHVTSQARDRDVSSTSSHWSDDVRPLAEINTSPLSTPVRSNTRRLNKAVTFTNDTKTNDGDSPNSRSKYGAKRNKPSLGSPVYERPKQTFHLPKDGYIPQDEISAFSDSSDDESPIDNDKSRLKRLMHVRRKVNLDPDFRPSSKGSTGTDTRPSSSASNATVSFFPSHLRSTSSAASSIVSPASDQTPPCQQQRALLASSDLMTSITSLSINTTHRPLFQRNSDSSCQSTISTSTIPTPSSSFDSNSGSFTSTSSSGTTNRLWALDPWYQLDGHAVVSPPEKGTVKRIMEGLRERGSLRELRKAARGRGLSRAI